MVSYEMNRTYVLFLGGRLSGGRGRKQKKAHNPEDEGLCSMKREKEKSRLLSQSGFLVEEDGFEPSKSSTTDLQSAPFGHSGTPPYAIGAGGRTRTPDLLITNQLLYQLSYTSTGICSSAAKISLSDGKEFVKHFFRKEGLFLARRRGAAPACPAPVLGPAAGAPSGVVRQVRPGAIHGRPTDLAGAVPPVPAAENRERRML